MDLHTVETYLCPAALSDVPDWQPDWAWLAGGTWLLGEPQRQLKTLVDLQTLGWSELEVTEPGLVIGATCTMSRLLDWVYPTDWTAVQALQCAVQELASFKIQNVATIAGNLCLALPASTFAPVMVLLAAEYEILALNGTSRWIAAANFQTGARQTQLQPGEVLRRVVIPTAMLRWRVNYRRLCVATAGLAVTIVAVAYQPQTQQVRVAIGAALPKPELLTFAAVPTQAELMATLTQRLPLDGLIADDQASAAYRRHVTQVLVVRLLQEIIGGE
jgi:CO/xanthine dehydrogenase FAD-binding subunit